MNTPLDLAFYGDTFKWRTELDPARRAAVEAEAVRHAETGVESALVREPVEYVAPPDRLWRACYWDTYQMALAMRYVRENGLTEQLERARADMEPITRELVNDAGLPIPAPDTWWQSLVDRGEEHTLGNLMQGFLLLGHLARLEEIERKEAELARREREGQRRRPGHRLGTSAIRNLGRSYEERRAAVQRAYRLKKLTQEERDRFLSDDAASLKSDELLVAALLLEYAKQEGQLRDVPTANYRFGAISMDLRIVVEEVPAEQMARDLGADVDPDGRADRNVRNMVTRALETLQDPRFVLVEEREVPPQALTDGTKKPRGGKPGSSIHKLERTALVTSRVDETGRREWLLHSVLALGYHRGAVYLDRAAWRRGQDAIGSRYLTEEMQRADVYFRMLAPGVFNEMERKRRKDPTMAPASPEAGEEKALLLATLLDRVGLPPEHPRGTKYLVGQVEKLLQFCQGTGAIIGYSRWEAAPKRKGAKPELRGFLVRLPVPAVAAEDDGTLSLFDELDHASGALPAAG